MGEIGKKGRVSKRGGEGQDKRRGGGSGGRRIGR
jgi:hypothetical protein